MAKSNKNRILLEATITGTGTYTISPVAGPWRSTLTGHIADGNTFDYEAHAVDANGNPTGTAWETGLGTVGSSGTTLARTTLYESSTGAIINWGASTHVYISCTPVTQGTVIIRDVNGVVGSNELQLSVVSGESQIRSVIGDLKLTCDDSHVLQFGRSSDGVVSATLGCGASPTLLSLLYSGQVVLYASAGGDRRLWLVPGVIYLPSDFAILSGASTDASTSIDIGLVRSGASTFSLVKDGSGTPGGMIQNTGGESALASAFTNATATFASTNLSLTFPAGRSFRIEGYLIISNSTATEGAQFDFNGGTATATTFDVAFSAVGSVTPGTVASTSLSGVLNYTVVTGTDRVFVRGYIKVNAGGTFILRAAENTTALGTFTLAAGSWLAAYDTVRL